MSESGDASAKFVAGRETFLRYLKDWESEWPSRRLAEVVDEAGGPERVAIICVDVTNEFVKTGRLASARVASIVLPIVGLFRIAHSLGVRNFLLPQDAHPENSPQFEAYGPHSMPGTIDAETVSELRDLAFSNLFDVMPKQSLNPGIDTEFPVWLDGHPEISRYIVVGDCTDLCVYQIAMYLRLRANQYTMNYEVIVPEDCVDTFETEFDKARRLCVMPHDADLLHLIFLYHMALNGIQIVRALT